MRRADMNRVVHEELRHIPRGSLSQNELRMMYALERRHDLAADAATEPSVTFTRAVADVRRRDPGFMPIYDDDLLARSSMNTSDR